MYIFRSTTQNLTQTRIREVIGKKEKEKSNLVITVDELLLAKADEFAGREEVSTFQSSGGAETPARPARSLIGTPT